MIPGRSGHDAYAALGDAVKRGDVAETRRLLAAEPSLRHRIDEPRRDLSFGSTLLLNAVSQRNLDLADALLEAGADINVRSGWWAGGFGVLDTCAMDLAPALISRGATVGPYQAARLGMVDALREMLARDPSLVHARGGDGQTPLHVAANVGIARLLVESGADIDALDVDHESTPCQYLIRERQDVVRYLLSAGARSDILMAAALGDEALAAAHLERNPDAIRTRVSSEWFPMRNRHAGGTIYTWTLGADKTAHAIAREFGHPSMVDFLNRHSPPALRFVVACTAGDAAAARKILDENPGLLARMSPDELAALPTAARDNDLDAVRTMLDVGWPIDVLGPEQATALHWSAFHGNAAIARRLLEASPQIELRETTHGGTALDWAIHGSFHGWYRDSGDYASVVTALLDAGAKVPDDAAVARASEAVQRALRRQR